MSTKRCSRCGTEKPYDAFYKNVSQKAGLSAECKECHKARMAAYCAKNKEKIAASDAAYRAKSKGKIAAYSAAYRAKNREKIAASQAEYYVRNKEKMAVQKAAYVPTQAHNLDSRNLGQSLRFPICADEPK